MRRFATVAMGLLALGMLVARAEAAELKGFGPIKFGMSKVEALEAIDRRGEWIGSDLLRYILPIENLRIKESLQVLQTFANGQASDVVARFTVSRTPRDCLLASLHFVGEIKRKYGKEPLVSHGVAREIEHSEGKSHHIIEDMYVFMFDAGASIDVELTARFEPFDCDIVIAYRTPSDLESPF